MGWAQDGAVTSSIVRTATVIGADGLGSEELESESAIAYRVDVVPGSSSEFSGPGATMAVPGPPVGVPVPPAWFPKSDPTALG